jgi:Ni,Fe-hydrogenase III small subunit/NAD-dependent dihydropyrimidine dehydrogenase PreA subunit
MFRAIDKGVRRKGVVTMPIPRTGAIEIAHNAPTVDTSRCTGHAACVEACPTAAVERRDGKTMVDARRCILCGECVRSCPDCAISLSGRAPEDENVEALGRELKARIGRSFGRSLAIREVDAGSCNACEVEVNALANPTYDLERFGLHIVASPRHADVLLVTGPVTRNMEHALMQTYRATPSPKLVVAMGACACSGGMFRDNYANRNGVAEVLPVDAYIPGCPPKPVEIIQAFISLMERMDETGASKKGAAPQPSDRP